MQEQHPQHHHHPHHDHKHTHENNKHTETSATDNEKEKAKNEQEDTKKEQENPEITNFNLESVLTYQEEIPLGVPRQFADNLDHAFAPCRLTMVGLFRFPLLLHVTPDFDREFKYSWKSLRGWMFFITGALMFLNAILITFTLVGILLNYPLQPKTYDTTWKKKGDDIPQHKTQEQLRLEEMFLIQRNFVPVVMLLLSLCHICTSDVSLFFKRTFVARYFTFWDEAVEIMKIDAAKKPNSVRKAMLRIVYFYLFMMLSFFGLSVAHFAPMTSGGPGQLVILWGRTFYPPIHAYKHFGIIRYFGDFVFAYIVVCSKIYILLFVYKCKILKNAFAIWNGRLESVFHGDEMSKTRKERCENRTGFDHLFRDFVVLLDLLRGSDTLFANIIESYYGTQVFSICFEVYYFARALSAHEEFKYARKLDSVVMGLYLMNSIFMLFLTSTCAAEVSEVAMDGLEIIRRKGFMGRKKAEEANFILSIYMSFTGHFETALTGGKYMIFDKGFLVALVGAIFSYLIILFQFTPPLAVLDQKKLKRIIPIDLLLHIEETHQFADTFQIGYLISGNATNFTY